MRTHWHWLGVALMSALLAGCGTSTAQTSTGSASTPSATAPGPTATATAAPTATATPITGSEITFTCPTTVSGATKVFTDTESGLSFSYPAAWTEANCQRIGYSNGQQTILIGNLFFVSIAPRNNLTIQQWVNQQASSDETVTLTALTVAHADAAVTVSVTASQQSSSPPPLAQVIAIVAGSQNFYEVSKLVAQMSATDTVPKESTTQLTQQVITTFNVP